MYRWAWNFLCVFAVLGLHWHLAQAAEPKIGVLMLHGKNPGDNSDPNFRPLKRKFEAEGWVVSFPDMPWSSRRYIDGSWDQAMEEISQEVKSLRAKGATKIILVGHSIGAPAALSFAARGGDTQGLVLLAPGHVPSLFYRRPAIRESVEAARALVAEGKGAERGSFNDFNQGRNLRLAATASNYLSYLDPRSDAEMSLTASRVPAATPVLSVIGDSDPLFPSIRAYYVDKLPAHANSRLLEVKGTHLSTPEVAFAEVLVWMKSVIAD
jgi:pimeloyl-ACP methyl ester carboxylesterase